VSNDHYPQQWTPADIDGRFSSLIQPRTAVLDVHHIEQAPEVRDARDLRRTPPRRLGKRVGTAAAHDRLANGE